ncbi:hypothetical protein [Tsukamurella tyrosinosolvens]|uniref:hypothetical protein n=1 Tax=Tsukamurella tyrosinosolvens TaxID=57704 RepID=UPI0007B1D2F8|nr:hypothetical protein [Tsukamurella tyrosinosolvens]KZL97730.1 hypothetical protein AXX05_01945 [Tsukamurella tyrosinosolvens]
MTDFDIDDLYERDDEPADDGPCDCDCHDYFCPDGLGCVDGWCDMCGELGGGDESMPRHPNFDCGCDPICDHHPNDQGDPNA